MSLHVPQRDELLKLIGAICNEAATAAQVDRLESLMLDDAEARRVYRQYMSLHASLRRYAMAYEHEAAAVDLESITHHAVDDAGTAVFSGLSGPMPAARMARRAASPPLPLWKQRSVRAFAATFLIAATAIFSMLAYMQALWNRPHDPGSIVTRVGPIAELVRVEDAVWGQSDLPTREGAELIGGRMKLESGLAQIRFFGGATVLLEGPAELELRTATSAYLARGRLSAAAPAGAEGFAIHADRMAFVDLGTAFGIDLTEAGTGELHVFEGRVQADVLDAEGQSLRRVEVTGDQAVRLDADAAHIEPVDADARRFVRHLPPKPYDLDLADMIAGGDGRGGGNAVRYHGINPANGRMDAAAGQGRLWGDYRYHRVEISPYIDGVFIPDGKKGPVTLDSAGHATDRLPATTNGAQDLVRRGGTRDQDEREANFPPVLDGVDFRTAGHSVIGLHANAGVTVDLTAIRETNAEMAIARFASVTGVIDKGKHSGRVEVWVFVDGRLRFHRPNLRGDGRGHRIEIPLTPSDRFLTLVTTDGGNGTGHDWLIFGDPRLQLVPTADADDTKR